MKQRIPTFGQFINEKQTSLFFIEPQDLMEVFEKLPEKIQDDYLYKDGNEWILTSEWIVGNFAGRGFNGKTKEDVFKQLIEYFNNEINQSKNSMVKRSLEKVGWPDMNSLKNSVFKQFKIKEAKTWQDIEVGDNVHVNSLNKTGFVIKTYGRKFQVKFIDDTEKTVDANDIEVIVEEKATSVSQQRLFGMAWAVRNGDMKREDASDEVLKIADSEMTDKEIEDFAKTKHEGLPKHVEEAVNEKKNDIVKFADVNIGDIAYSAEFTDREEGEIVWKGTGAEILKSVYKNTIISDMQGAGGSRKDILYYDWVVVNTPDYGKTIFNYYGDPSGVVVKK